MIEDHDRIEELLAGYALRGLSGEDAELADRLLVEHVPGCPRCRDSLTAFQAVAGELAFTASPKSPPDLLLPRIRKELGGRPLGRRRPLSMWASVGVAAAALASVITWNALLNQRVSHAEGRSAQLSDVLSFIEQPGSNVVPLQTQRPTRSQVLAMYAPGVTQMYLYATDIPDPEPGHVYRLWFGKDGEFVRSIEFLPDDGFVALPLLEDLSAYDQLLITEEDEGPPGSQPTGVLRWFKRLPRS